MGWISRQGEVALRQHLPIPIARAELERYHSEAVRRRSREQRIRWTVGGTGVVGAAVVFLVLQAIPFGGTVGMVVAWALFSAILLALFAVTRSRYTYHLRRVLREHGHEVCPRCGYYLAALETDVSRCPECGAPRVAM